MLILIILILLITVLFLFIKHPLRMGITLIIQTVLISILTGRIIKSFWFSYILLIILLSGALVLFIYIARIASNEKFYSSVLLTKLIIIIIITSTIICYLIDNVYKNIINNEIIRIFLEIRQEITLIKIFNMQNIQLTILLILYLLFTIIVVTYNVNIFEGPIRAKN